MIVCSPSLLVTMSDSALNQVMAALERLQLLVWGLLSAWVHILLFSTQSPTLPILLLAWSFPCPLLRDKLNIGRIGSDRSVRPNAQTDTQTGAKEGRFGAENREAIRKDILQGIDFGS